MSFCIIYVAFRIPYSVFRITGLSDSGHPSHLTTNLALCASLSGAALCLLSHRYLWINSLTFLLSTNSLDWLPVYAHAHVYAYLPHLTVYLFYLSVHRLYLLSASVSLLMMCIPIKYQYY